MAVRPKAGERVHTTRLGRAASEAKAKAEAKIAAKTQSVVAKAEEKKAEVKQGLHEIYTGIEKKVLEYAEKFGVTLAEARQALRLPALSATQLKAEYSRLKSQVSEHAA